MASPLEGTFTMQVVLACAVVFIAVLLFHLSMNTLSSRAKRLGARLPPGPRPAFLVGNAFNFPRKAWYETFSLWADEYGEVVYINLLGTPMIILNSLEAVTEIMDKRMSAYSNRPASTMGKLTGLNFATARVQPGPEFNEQRRVFRKALSPQVVTGYDGFIQRDRDALLRRLDGFSGDPFEVFTKVIGAVLTRISYGEQFFRDHGEELVDNNVEIVNLATWMSTKLWLVDVFPLLQHLPDWLPGLTFKRIIRRANILIRKIRYQPFESIVSRIADGTADESLLVKYLDEGSFSHNNLRDAIATLYGAAIDTTSTALLNLFYIIVLYPEWQQKVHEELDSVLGRGHLPTREEIRNLSIFNAVWKEAFRLNPPAPIGVPHVGMKEDVWRGYYFPKGTIVHCNIGYILREKGIWGEDSHSFNPTRFLPEFNPRAAELPNMLDLPFGFGRRICPGRHLADHIAPQYAVALLVTYQILPMEGHLLGGKIGFADSAVRRISGFQCHFKPRS